MSNLGRAVYMAAFAMMFIVAATTAIYLYSTLNSYLETSTNLLNVNKRAESSSTADNISTVRPITRSEIYITLYNMKQMNVSSLTVNENTVSADDVAEKKGAFVNIKHFLDNNPNVKFSYKADGSEVTYRSKVN